MVVKVKDHTVCVKEKREDVKMEKVMKLSANKGKL